MPRTKKKAPKRAVQAVRPAVSREKEKNSYLWPFLFLAFWLAFCATTVTFPGYVWLNPLQYQWVFYTPSWEVSLALLALMFVAAKLAFREKLPVTDLSPFWIRWGLFAALGLAVFLCSYHATVPIGNYGDDTAFPILEPRRMKDLSDYRGTFVYNFGILPTWPYVAWGLWNLLPHLPALVLQRLTNEIFDLATVIVIYQAGKEFAGRRMGLYCAAIVVIAKPLLYKVVSGYSYSILPLFMALVFWGILRLTRKDASHPFMWWGIAVGLSAYSCYPIQPFVTFFIFATLLFVWWNNRDTMSLRNSNVFVWISSALIIIYGLYCTGSLPLEKWWGFDLHGVHARISSYLLIAALVLIAGCLVGLFPGIKKDPWYQWTFGAWLAALISFPGLTHPNIMERIRQHGWVQGSDYFSWSYISTALQHLPETFHALFWEYVDRSDMALNSDPFFSYTEMILICLGLVCCLVKPDSKRILLVISAMVGLVPHFFAGMVHSGLLLSCLVPFWMIAAVGLNDLTEMVLKLVRVRAAWVLFTAVLMVFWGWSAWTVFSRVHTQWEERPEDIMLLYDKVKADIAKGDRVYFCNEYFFRPEGIIYEGSPFYFWNIDTNPIDIAPNDKLPNVDLYMPWDVEPAYRKRIAPAFPNAQWQEIRTPLEAGVKSYRCVIPSADILKNKNKLLMFHPVQGEFWKRTWSSPNYCLDFSGITWTDDVADVNTPPPPGRLQDYYENVGLKLEGTIHVGQDGKYEVTCDTGNRTILVIDGKKLIDMTFPRIWDYVAPAATQKNTVSLTKGDHSVEVVTFFEYRQLPNIKLKALNLPGDAKSLWSGFNF